MEGKKRIHSIQPGLPEAIHPDIGNEALFELDTHRFLLRSPDPLKELDNRIAGEDAQARIIVAWSNTGGHGEFPVPLESVAVHQGSKPVIASETSGMAFEEKAIEAPPDTDLPRNRKSKAKEKVEDQKIEEKKEHYEPEASKSPKAGKRVKKAAKTVLRQEEDARKLIQSEKSAPTEPTLSPFTQWLKGLRGSEYVHPYDDDFAIYQGAGPGKEGISETFADLLAAQGYREQAVEMYMKLMQKYPEKSGFFAAKIEALQP